ncbi:MAG: hypothetical protein Q8P10_02765 [bacterium]|nr:hypothetical protein [bacterium]
MSKIIRDKIIICTLIVLISLVYGLPNLILSKKLGNLYAPITMNGLSPFGRDEAYAYAPSVNYILSRNFPLKEAYVYEYLNFPTPFMGETLPATIMAFLSKLSGQIDKSFLIADFIFPPLIFLLLFIVCRILGVSHIWAVSSAIAATISRDFIAAIPYPLKTIQILTFSEGQNFPLYFSRAFHPQITFPLFSIFLISLLLQIKNKNAKYTKIITGITLGGLFYSYVFYWTYAVFFLFLLLLYFLIKKETKIIKDILISLTLALVIATPYLKNMLDFYNLELSSDFSSKAALHGLPLPLTLIRYIFIASIFLLISKKKNNTVTVFAIFLVSGVLIAPVAKIILGQDLETFHYLRRALMPYATLAFFISVYNLVKVKTKLTNILACALIILFVFIGTRNQLIATNKIESAHVKDLDQRSVLNWLATNANNSVVGSLDTNLNLLLPVYTNSFTYFPSTDRTVMPTAEGIQRFIVLSNLLNISLEKQKESLLNLLSYLFIFQAYDGSRGLDPNSPRRWEAEEQITKKYNNADDLYNKYKLDYLVLTPSQIKIAKPDTKFLTAITSINEYIIFKLKKQ